MSARRASTKNPSAVNCGFVEATGHSMEYLVPHLTPTLPEPKLHLFGRARIPGRREDRIHLDRPREDTPQALEVEPRRGVRHVGRAWDPGVPAEGLEVNVSDRCLAQNPAAGQDGRIAFD